MTFNPDWWHTCKLLAAVQGEDQLGIEARVGAGISIEQSVFWFRMKTNYIIYPGKWEQAEKKHKCSIFLASTSAFLGKLAYFSAQH